MPRGTPPRHPKPARLAAFFLAQVGSAEREEIVRHLFGGCEPCRAKMREWLAADESLPPKMARRSPTEAYDFVLRKAENLAAAADAARRRALSAVEPLLADEPGRHPVIAWTRARALLARARSLRRADPAAYEVAAGWALVAAQELPPALPNAKENADHLARAWAEVGNAHRRHHDYTLSERAFEAAMLAVASGTCVPILLAELLDLSSSLWADLHRFEVAESQIALAETLYRQVGDLEAASRACLSLGRFTSQRGKKAGAIRHYCRAFDQIDPTCEPVLWSTALYNILDALTDLGQFEAAERFFGQVRELIERHVQAEDRVRLQWLSGRIDVGLGRLHRAELSLRRARERFARMDLPFLAALASLDLCQVWLREGRTAEVRAAVDQILGQFTARGIAREALATLVLLEQAARQEKATLALVREAAQTVATLERGGR